MADNLGIRLVNRPADATGKIPAYASYWDTVTDLIEAVIENLARQGHFEGLLTSPALTANDPDDMKVSFSDFQCLNDEGIYCDLATSNVTHDAADGSNPRIDIICVNPAVQTSSGEITTSGIVAITKGTAVANPLVPATPSNYLKIGEVDIATGASTVALRNWKPMYVPLAMFRPTAQDTPNMTIKVNVGRGYIGSTLVDTVAQNSPSFSAPAATKCAIDILHIDSSGTLAITQGTEVVLPNEPSAPTYPTDKIVICEVYLEAGDTAIYQSQIKDVRPLLRSFVQDLATDGLHSHQIARATYDFSEHGGVQGDIGLGVTLPDNAIIVKAWYEVLTTLTSNTDAATIAIGLPTDDAGGIFSAIAISDASNPWDAGNFGISMDLQNKTTAARELTLTVAGGEDVTAGKFIVWCEYVVSD